MNIYLQHLNGRIQICSQQSILSWSITGQLDSISIRNLLTVNQLYNEQFCMTDKNAIVFNFTQQENSFEKLNSFYSQFVLRMTSIQYIHTQDFLRNLIDFIVRFQQNKHIYDRFKITFNSIISHILEQANKIHWTIEIENIFLILPEYQLKKSVFVFQLNSISLHNYFLIQNESNTLKNLIDLETVSFDFISIEIKNIKIYSTIYCLLNEKSSILIYFKNFGFSQMPNECLSLVDKQFSLTIKMKYNLINATSATYTIKIYLSPIDFLLDLNQYQFFQQILFNNFNEDFFLMIKNQFNSLTLREDDSHIIFTFVVEIDRVGLKLFADKLNMLTSFDYRQSLLHPILTNLHISFDQYSNGNQSLRLLSSKLQLILKTEHSNVNMIDSLLFPSNCSNQLEIDLLITRFNQTCTINLNSIRFFLIIDWLLENDEFLNKIFNESTKIDVPISFISFEIKLNLNRFEFAIVPTSKDPYANAFVYSSTIIFNYKKDRTQSLACFINDLTFFTCQIGCIDETAISIMDPVDCTLNIQTLNEILNEQICTINIPILRLNLSYSNIKIIYFLFNEIYQQIFQIKIQNFLIRNIMNSLLRNCKSSQITFLNMKYFKFNCHEIYLCLIDDCFNLNIPLLNINLKSLISEMLENNDLNRQDQVQFELNISYYNRFQSGFEPLLESCSLQMTLNQSTSSISLFITSNNIINLNFTQAMYRMYHMIETNWLNDCKTISSKQKNGFRRVQPLDSYCFTNLIGIQTKFRTWITVEQKFDSHEYIVDDKQTISFCFPHHSSQNRDKHLQMRPKANSIVASLFETDRRLLITIDGWQSLKPISIDRIGTFLRLAIPSNDDNPLLKPILVIIEITMTEYSIRSITIRSPIKIYNYLLTSIDIRFKCYFDLSYEFCLESNQSCSLPIQYCSILKQIQMRPTNFSLDYCNDPIEWTEIDNEAIQIDNNK